MVKTQSDFKPEAEAVVNVPRLTLKTNAQEVEHILLHLLRNAAWYTELEKITLELKKKAHSSTSSSWPILAPAAPPSSRPRYSDFSRKNAISPKAAD